MSRLSSTFKITKELSSFNECFEEQTVQIHDAYIDEEHVLYQIWENLLD